MSGWWSRHRPISTPASEGWWSTWPSSEAKRSIRPGPTSCSPRSALPSADVTEHARDGNGSDRSPLVPASVPAAAMVFVEDPALPVLDQADTHHLTAVLRLRDGEIVVAGDGAGRWATCRMRIGPSPGATLERVGPVETTEASAPAVTVAFAPVKGDRPEWVVQKLTELGVDRIVPILTARSVVRWEGERATKAVERLRRVAREGAAQSR